MKKQLALVLGIFTLMATAASAQDISDLTDGLTTFVEDATGSLPFAATAGMDWSDAYIGSIIGVPPHFGVGLVVGTTTLPGQSVKPLIEALGGELATSDVPLPLAAVNARIGGVILPFDIGVRVGILPPGLSFGDYTVTYQNFGLDARWAFFQGEPVLPTVSVGAGFGYLATGLKATYGDALTFTGDLNGTNRELYISAPELTMDLSTVTFEAKVQVSKSLLILTPYLGLSALTGSSTAKAGVSSDITTDAPSLDDWADLIGGISATGFSQEKSVSNFGLKLYGGTSLNLVFVRFDIQGMYNLFDGAYGATLGARFQL